MVSGMTFEKGSDLVFEKHPNRALSILIAEDDPANQLVALRMLKTLGYNADTVDNGLEALIAMESRSYNLVLMDIQMPVMDGLAATQAIRNSPNPYAGLIPIIAMTANAFKEDIMKCLEAGMDVHIAKPVDYKILLSKIKMFFQGSREHTGTIV